MQVWRICKRRYSDAAFTGEGARLYSGRWNPAGVRMVYTSSSLSLAALEFFVHLDPSVAPDDLVSVSAIIPTALKVERFASNGLPVDWRTAENPKLQAMGAAWASGKRSVAVEVPSIVIEGEWNVLLNPAHPQFSKIQVAQPVPFHFDRRLFKAR
jgi:RES domain-containing protein